MRDATMPFGGAGPGPIDLTALWAALGGGVVGVLLTLAVLLLASGVLVLPAAVVVGLVREWFGDRP